MYIYNQNDAVPWDECAATVGFFDGVHAGHRYLLEELKNAARENHLNSVVVTFDVHPRKVLNADFQPKLLTTLNEKTAQLENNNMDACVVLNFNQDFAHLTAYEFIKYILRDRLKVKTLLVGHDHRFGHNRSQGFNDYQKIGEELGIKVLQAGQFTQENHAHISSSEVRHSLEAGNIRKANEILTYPYSFRGKVVEGNQIGRQIGFPTANIQPEDKDKIIPAIGVYEVLVTLDEKTYKGMLNIGKRPTVSEAEEVKIEVHIIDFEEYIYNKNVKIEFVNRIRDEIKFANLEELKAQLQKDRKMIS